MRRLIPIVLLALSLGACANLTALTNAVTSTVKPTDAIIAGNAFDAVESGATAFLTFCKATPADSTCIAANRRKVIQYVRSGRAARNQMETYVQTSASIPSAIYNTLITAVNNLRNSPAANFAGVH